MADRTASPKENAFEEVCFWICRCRSYRVCLAHRAGFRLHHRAEHQGGRADHRFFVTALRVTPHRDSPRSGLHHAHGCAPRSVWPPRRDQDAGLPLEGDRHRQLEDSAWLSHQKPGHCAGLFCCLFQAGATGEASSLSEHARIAIRSPGNRASISAARTVF